MWTNLNGLIQSGAQIGAPEAVASSDQNGCFEIVAPPRQLWLRGIFGEGDCDLGVRKGGFEVAVAFVRGGELRGKADARRRVEVVESGRHACWRNRDVVR